MFLHRFKLKNYCCVVIWMCIGLFMVACAPREQTIVLLHTNDSHGSILPVSGVGGMAERATVIDSLRKLRRLQTKLTIQFRMKEEKSSAMAW